MGFDFAISLVSFVLFLSAIFFSYMLSKEAGGEKYWVFLVISSIALSASHFASTGFFAGLNGQTASFVQEIGQLIGAFSLAYAVFGLYSSMKKIREKLSAELSED